MKQLSTGDSLDVRLEVPFAHRLRWTRGVFDLENPVLDGCIDGDAGGRVRGVVFVDSGVAGAMPRLRDEVLGYLCGRVSRVDWVEGVHVVPGGEVCKNDPGVLESIHRAMHDARLCRRSYVLVIGGGAVLDAVGFAAATAHRGVRLIRVPTTTLSQGDSAVGVKNGVNRFGQKNYLGTFGVPWAVVNDAAFLETLPVRVWRAGFSEAVKVALVQDAGFFGEIEDGVEPINLRDAEVGGAILRRSGVLHAEHIARGGDAFELTAARPLDFGHWSAHRLEVMTDFELLHGEAVAIGVGLDATYSMLAGLLSPGDWRRVVGCLLRLGFELSHPVLRDVDGLLAGLEEFRHHLGGRLTVPLLGGIGRGVEVHRVEAGRVVAAVGLLEREGGAGVSVPVEVEVGPMRAVSPGLLVGIGPLG